MNPAHGAPSPASTQLWLASTNPGKLREFSEAATAHGISVSSLPELDRLPPCPEDGSTFEENARRKAVYYSRTFAGLVFADDSGLCVDALKGAPGVFSARYGGANASDEANNARLLGELHKLRENADGVNEGEALSRAHYECAIVLAQGGRVLLITEGRADGAIIAHPRGSGGFGYDPFFFYPPLGQTFAELTPESKFAVSHRGEAFRKLIEGLQHWAPGTLPSRGDESPVVS